MKVYIVVGSQERGDYLMDENLGVFDSKKKAEEFTKKHEADVENIGLVYTMQKWELK